jgi:DNA gyrase subunit A
MIFTSLGQCIRFEVDKTREQGRSTRGVRGIKFKHDTDFVVDADAITNEEQELLTVSEKGIGKRTQVEEYRCTNRAGSGVISMKLSGKTGNVIGEVLVDDTQDLMLLTSIGKMIRVDMNTIRKAGRNTSGVIIVNVDKDDKVVSIAKCPKEDEEIEVDENGNVIRYNEDGEIIESIDLESGESTTLVNQEKKDNITPSLIDNLEENKDEEE